MAYRRRGGGGRDRGDQRPPYGYVGAGGSRGGGGGGGRSFIRAPPASSTMSQAAPSSAPAPPRQPAPQSASTSAPEPALLASSAPSPAALAKEVEKKLFVSETALALPAAAAQGTAAAAADDASDLDRAPVSKKGLAHPARPGLATVGKKVAINPESKTRQTNKEVLNEHIKVHKKTALGGKLPAYDGRKSLHSDSSLSFQTEQFVLMLVDPEMEKERAGREFRITIRIAGRTDLYHLQQFLCGRQRDMPQETIQVLDVVPRESPSWNYVTVSNSFFSTAFGHRGDIGEGLECWRGYYQSLLPIQMGLSLNIDILSTSFFKPVRVIKFVDEFLNMRDASWPLSDRGRVKIKKALCRVCIEPTHQQDQIRRYKITGVTSIPMSQLIFPVDDKGTRKTVVHYFWDKYNYSLKYGSWPCLQAGSDPRHVYLPMEVCKVVEGQRYSKKLNDRNLTNILRATCKHPQEREQSIRDRVLHNKYDYRFAQEFGIKLKYHDSGREKTHAPSVGQWSMINKKMINGGTVDNWTCLNFSRMCPYEVQRFCMDLTHMCNATGMVVNLRPFVDFKSAAPNHIENALRGVHRRATQMLDQQGVGNHLQLLIIILHEVSGSYGKIERVCETHIGIGSQCCMPKHASRPNKQCLENVALKINIQKRRAEFLGYGLTGSFRTIYWTEGLLGFYRGNGASVARIVPYAALRYMIYEEYFWWIFLGFPNVEQGPVLDLVLGPIAGGIAVICTYPLDLVRTKLANQIDLICQILYLSQHPPCQELMAKDHANKWKFCHFHAAHTELANRRFKILYNPRNHVGSDESDAGERQPKVSIWEVEPLTNFPMYPSPCPFGIKHQLSTGLPSMHGGKDDDMVNSPIWLQESQQPQQPESLQVPQHQAMQQQNLCNKVQFFVSLGGRSLSMQQFLEDTTVKDLIEYCCQQNGIRETEVLYAVFCGKKLCAEELLSHYPIHRDSIIDLRSRLRGGQETYTTRFSKGDADLFYSVVLSQPLENCIILDKHNNTAKCVWKLKKCTRFWVRLVLVFFTGQHRAGICYNGGFEKDDIIFGGGRVYLREGIAESNFSGQGCKLDFNKLATILGELKTSDGYYTQYFDHLIGYLQRCPFGENSRSDPAISFLINHPSIEYFADRMKQVMLVDAFLFHTLTNHKTPKAHKAIIKAALGAFGVWWDLLEYCPAMKKVLYEDSYWINGNVFFNALYTKDPRGGFHYSNNYFKHANKTLVIEQIEAAHSVNSKDLLPRVFEQVTCYAINPKNAGSVHVIKTLLDLITNDLAGPRSEHSQEN